MFPLKPKCVHNDAGTNLASVLLHLVFLFRRYKRILMKLEVVLVLDLQAPVSTDYNCFWKKDIRCGTENTIGGDSTPFLLTLCHQTIASLSKATNKIVFGPPRSLSPFSIPLPSCCDTIYGVIDR